MEPSKLLAYLTQTGWSESPMFANHYVKSGTNGIVAFDTGSNEAFIVESIGGIPCSRISSVEQFEQDLAHLQQ